MTSTHSGTTFPIDLAAYRPLSLDPARPELSAAERADLEANIQLCRDAIVFFTATGAARGVGGHTGGPYDTVPEVMILEAFLRGAPERFVPVLFDEAGHRVATQYLLAVLRGHLSPEALLHYREAHSGLPGHPELGLTPGIQFSSGRLGHLWPFVNGVALANPGKVVVCLGSDGAQQEGDDAEAARFAVANGLNVKLVIDDNDVTIAGHPSHYLVGYELSRTLGGHGLATYAGDGEDLDSLYRRLRQAVNSEGPAAVINHRRMAVGIEGIEGSPHGHDVIPLQRAIDYLERRGHGEAVAVLRAIEKPSNPAVYLGCGELGSNRNVFGDAVVAMLDRMEPSERQRSVLCVDSDLEGSCGLTAIRKAHPEIFLSGGIMERANFSAAAGFGMEKGRQGIFATFSAFLEMCISEFTMARLNGANVLCHFSHAGIDDMADNTCHFGLNNCFADNGLDEDDPPTRLYFPADAGQMKACVEAVFHDTGLRFLFSTRSKVPAILDPGGKPLHGDGYVFQPGRDELVREGSDGTIVSFGDALYRCLDAVERLRQEGIALNLVNKSTLNVVDEAMMARIGASPFVLVVESFNRRTGLGSRFGTWLLERGFTPRYGYLGTWREGCGGLWEQYPHQGLDPAGIVSHVRGLMG